MKIERTNNPLCFWRSLLSAIIVSGIVLFFTVLIGSLSSIWFRLLVVDVGVILSITAFFVVLIGHFIYYNFNVDFRRQCVFCHVKDYSMNMSVLRDKGALESVYFCRKHIIEVK